MRRGIRCTLEKRRVVDPAAKIVAILIGILLVAVPVVLLLMAYGVLSAPQVQSATGYQTVLRELEDLSTQHAQDGQLSEGLTWFGGVSAGVAVLCLVLLGQMAFVRARAHDAIVQDAPGRETRVRSRAIRHTAEYAARDAGALDPGVMVKTRRGRQDVACRFHTRELVRLPALAAGVQTKLKAVLKEQGLKVGTIEATVEEPAPSEAERVRVT